MVWAWCVLFACPALPCPAHCRPRNVNVHVRSQQSPGAAEPLYSLVLLVYSKFVLRSTVDALQ